MARVLIAIAIMAMWPCAVTSLKLIPKKSLRILFLFASTVGGLSALFGPGLIAATGSLLWLVASVALAALCGLVFLRNVTFDPIDMARLFAPTFVAFGCIWLVAANAEIELLGFSHTIVELTAAHFHAAGGCLVALTALSGIQRRHVINRVTSGLVLVSIPLTAIGIQFGGAAEGIGASFTIVAALLFACVQLKDLSISNPLQKTLRIISSISLIAAMCLAFAYSLQHYGFNIDLTVNEMVTWHATFNTFGFIGCGLAAHVIDSQKRIHGET